MIREKLNKELIKPYYDLELDKLEGVWLAGGALQSQFDRNLVAKDYDLFCQSREAFNDAFDHLNSRMEHGLLSPDGKTTTSNGVTFNIGGVDFQLLNRSWYSSVEVLISAFDITACQLAVDGDELLLAPTTKIDILLSEVKYNRHLNFEDMDYTAMTFLYRMNRYVYGKGFSLDKSEIAFVYNNVGQNCASGEEL